MYEEATEVYEDLKRLAYKRCKDRVVAEDVLQDTYEKEISNWGSYQDGTNCKAWLGVILRNTHINHTRKRKYEHLHDKSPAERNSPCQGHLSGDIHPPDHDVGKGISEAVRDALQQLHEEYRRVVVLVGLHGFMYKEVAYILDCPVGTVMSRLHRARKQLKPLLEGYSRREYAIV